MSDVIITVDRLSKRYRLGQIGATTLREFAERLWQRLRGRDPQAHMSRIGEKGLGAALAETRNSGRSGSSERNDSLDEIWALRDVSFEVKRGEVLGIIGRNGAGKSTLLKMLSRITEPTSGRAIIRGRVASLLEVGTGFHPELTGRENIYLNGAILGMRKAEIDRKFDEIVAFSEVERFIDTPVKRYSSGMYVRLAFAVAAHLEPEILILDEVLAVGDAAFQKKCLGKMGDVAKEGRTVLLVSHNMATIQGLCGRCLVLERGRVAFSGEPAVAVEVYMQNTIECMTAFADGRNHPNRQPGMAAIIEEVAVLDAAGKLCADFFQEHHPRLRVRYNSRNVVPTLAGCGIALEKAGGVRVGGFNSYMAFPPPHRLPAAGCVEFTLDMPHLTPGRYWVTVSLGSHQNHLVDKITRCVAFDVHPSDIYGTGYILTPADGVVALACSVKVEEL